MIELIILLLSIIQSIFGIGLLAIGTPLLLILNYDFLIILKILLPCSILVSVFQIITTKSILYEDKKLIYRSMPYVLLGAFVIYTISSKINFKLLIGFSILIVLFFKHFSTKKTNIFIKNKKKILICSSGFFHGLTNTGGPLISLIFQGLKKDKYQVQGCIAYTYFFYALIQYFLLNFFLKEMLLDYNTFWLLLFTCIGYFLGNIIFKKLKFNNYLSNLNIIVFLSSIYLIFFELKKYFF